MLVEPLTADARAWVEENVRADHWFGNAFACELRYVDDLLTGMADAGLRV